MKIFKILLAFFLFCSCSLVGFGQCESTPVPTEKTDTIDHLARYQAHGNLSYFKKYGPNLQAILKLYLEFLDSPKAREDTLHFEKLGELHMWQLLVTGSLAEDYVFDVTVEYTYFDEIPEGVFEELRSPLKRRNFYRTGGKIKLSKLLELYNINSVTYITGEYEAKLHLDEAKGY